MQFKMIITVNLLYKGEINAANMQHYEMDM